jgi:Tol biopolymer transport system component
MGAHRLGALLTLLLAATLAMGLLALVGTKPAEATFPGKNGKIAFASNRDGNYDIFVMNSDGSKQTSLTNDPASDVDPAFSPNAKKIAFDSFRDGNWEIYVMNADGSNERRLTNNRAVDEYPAFSPNGKKIAFDSNRNGNYEIFVMNSDGSKQTNLTKRAGDDYNADWGVG